MLYNVHFLHIILIYFVIFLYSCVDYRLGKPVAFQNEELSLQQQFKIVSLLCTYEYQCLLEADDTELSYYQRLSGEDELRMFRIPEIDEWFDE